tara:strand:- start:1971 stop:3449 length:1479 start_codon:yes stop_codon:yes gene_type:complete
MSKVPNPVPTKYNCTVDDLVGNVSIVITVKDTCTQAPYFFTKLIDMVPENINIIYVYPDFVGCNRVNVDFPIFKNMKVIKTSAEASPIDSFLAAQNFVTTPYTLLMHNDCYFLEKESICELYKPLEKYENVAFTAPQIFEKSSNGIIVPHGHHKNLHIRKTSNKETISYDIDVELLSRRHPNDFLNTEGPQINFMEDHSYMGRTHLYHKYLDPYASHTYEYLDNILSMRANNTYPWYSPSSRFVFDVDQRKIGWRDIPYFVFKRSEYVGNQVCQYLTNKWSLEFPVTGIWNYVKYDILHKINLDDNSIPSDWEGQTSLFYSWFESIGFNRYNDKNLPTFLNTEYNKNETVIIKRVMNQPFYDSSLKHKVPPHAFLPVITGKKIVNITLGTEFLPINFEKTSSCNPDDCGMLVVDKDKCMCFVYIPPFNIGESNTIIKILDTAKLPSRAYNFLQMKYNTNVLSNKCMENTECMYTTFFPPTSRIIKWSWFPFI